MALKVPLSWLREYIDINVTPEELAHRLTLAGQEVEHIVTIGSEWENIYTGQVVRLEQHPNADRLNLATVDYGKGDTITVVTGAPNIEEGQKVVLGLLGSRYLDQHSDPPRWSTLKPAKIRGIQTEGMVMSEAELALSEEHEGIIVLDPATPLGLPASEILGDTILEIDVTPNNGRVLSMIGVAREVAAIFGGEVRYPSTEWQTEGPPAESLLRVQIDDPDLCPRYTGAVIKDVQIGPSPDWMQRRLILAGMRPINNVVDITNYVMLEMGQPMHPFSYDAVHGHKIIVRRAHPGEEMTTLDHVQRRLDPNMLVIADVDRPVALAGVMGGEDSEIGEGSNTVLLESAHFNPLSIRRTARLLRLPSEAAYRFERFVDPNLTVPAMKRAAEMMRTLAGGKICEGYVDAYPRPAKPRRIHFYTSEVDRLLGIHIPPSRIADILRRLEFQVDLPPNADTVGADTTMLVDVPTYRNDVVLPADLVEEVARITGYDLIPETLITGGLPPQEVNRKLQFEERLRDIMVACAMDEVLTYTVTHSSALEKLTQLEANSSVGGDGTRPSYRSWDTSRRPVTIVNPLSSKQDVMRATLIPNMLDTLRENMKMRPDAPVRIFEVGKIFMTPTPEEVEARKEARAEEKVRYPRLQNWDDVPYEELLPMEPSRLMGVMSGRRWPKSRFDQEPGPESQVDFFDAKGVVQELLAQLHIGEVQYVPGDAPLFHPGRSAIVRSGDTDLGIVGELHPAVAEAWDLPDMRVALWDFSVDALAQAMPERVRSTQVSPYTPITQDMAFVMPDNVGAAAAAEVIRKAASPYVTNVSLFDIYTGKPIPEGNKSLAFAVTFSDPERPLTEEDVARLRKKIEGRMERELGAKLRT